MKNWTLFILLFFAKINFACGPMYPYGDDVRMSLISPFLQNSSGFEHFRLTTQLYYTPEISYFQKINNSENISLWFDFFKGTVSKADLYELIYETKLSDVKIKVQYNPIYAAVKKDKEAYFYILFAISSSNFNGDNLDPWEREPFSKKLIKSRKKQIKKAISLSKKTTNAILKRRYNYLAIRMSYYGGFSDDIKKMYFQNFASKSPEDAIDYWSMFFYAMVCDSERETALKFASVFANSSEKRYAVQLNAFRAFPLDKLISEISDSQEKANILAWYTSSSLNHNSFQLDQIYSLDPKNKCLPFLIEREIEKIEDWILTPYYSNFEYSFSGNSLNKETENYVKKRVEEDRKYALTFRDWLLKINKNDAYSKLQIAYLTFLGNESSTAESISSIDVGQNESLIRFKNIVQSLNTIRISKIKNLSNSLLQKTITEEYVKKNNHFLFAVAREMEYADNTNDCAYLLSFVNQYSENLVEESFGEVFWRSSYYRMIGFQDYYYEYFLYLDASYSVQQVENLIVDLDKTSTTESQFDAWKKSLVLKDKERLYDLVGTKYVRQDNLPKALEAFKNVSDQTWKRNDLYYTSYLKSNTFAANFYSEYDNDLDDTVAYTKKEIVSKIIEYKANFEKFSGTKKAYYAFLLGNAYFNMTQYGNSWMMRRYAWSIRKLNADLEDEEEYFSCTKAIEYYLLAHDNAEENQSKAMALRMAAKCENYHLLYEKSKEDDWYELEYEDQFADNKYFKTLKAKYKSHHRLFESNCHSFYPYQKDFSEKAMQ